MTARIVIHHALVAAAWLRPVTVPLYATYLFADVDQGPPWQAIRRQPGVIGLVMTGDAPSRCPESEILKLKAAEVGVVFGSPTSQDRTAAGSSHPARRSRSSSARSRGARPRSPASARTGSGSRSFCSGGRSRWRCGRTRWRLDGAPSGGAVASRPGYVSPHALRCIGARERHYKLRKTATCRICK